LQAPVLQAADDCLVAAAGRGFKLFIQGRLVGFWRAAFVRRGEVIHFAADGDPGWGYLAAAGGIDVPLVMGSRSTYLRGGFGGCQGRVLREGDALPLGRPAENWFALAGGWLPPDKIPPYGGSTIPVILGPQVDYFSPQALDTFLNSQYTVSAASDRMGYRLSGPPVHHSGRGELLSEGIATGSVQLPADGQPIVLLSDRPTTGGYPKIATVTRAGLALLAQSMPGTGQVRFSAVSLKAARAAYRTLMVGLETGVQSDED
jgi:antagonist of KipI